MPSSLDAITIMEPRTSTPPFKSRELVIQEALTTDAEAIAKVGAATFALSFAHSMPTVDMQAYLEEAYTPTAISKEIASNQNQFFVARLKSTEGAETGEVAGFIQMKLGTTDPCIPPDVQMCELHRIYVSPDYHGGGTGQLLVERGLSWAQDQVLGSKRLDLAVDTMASEEVKKRRAGIWLGVWEENVKAQRFYRRWGFERLGAHDFIMGGTTQTDFVMVKWL